MSPGLGSVLDGLQGYGGMEKKGRASVKMNEGVFRCDYAKISAAENDKPESAEADNLIQLSWDRDIVGFGDF